VQLNGDVDEWISRIIWLFDLSYVLNLVESHVLSDSHKLSSSVLVYPHSHHQSISCDVRERHSRADERVLGHVQRCKTIKIM
jgi:hypothetical protein